MSVDLQKLLEVSRSLAQYASYAEIVGGVSVNRQAIRQECDALFAIIATLPIDENFEPTIPSLELAEEGRDEIARILEMIAEQGLPHPRNLDAAIDAIVDIIRND